MNFAGLFDYFQHGEVFLLVRDGVQYPIIFPIHSRIIPFYSRNFTFITQEITNTLLKNFPYSLKNYPILLKKFYLYNPRNYEHLTHEIRGSLVISDILGTVIVLLISKSHK